jgi:hypothetical protein
LLSETPLSAQQQISRQALKRGRKLRPPFRHRQRMLKTFAGGVADPDVPE